MREKQKAQKTKENQIYALTMDVTACYLYFLIEVLRKFAAFDAKIELDRKLVTFSKLIPKEFQRAVNAVHITPAENIPFDATWTIPRLQRAFTAAVKQAVKKRSTKGLYKKIERDVTLLVSRTFHKKVKVNFITAYQVLESYIRQISNFASGAKKPVILLAAKEVPKAQDNKPFMKLGGDLLLPYEDSDLARVINTQRREKGKISNQIVQINQKLGEQAAKVTTNLFTDSDKIYDTNGIGISSIFVEFIYYYINVIKLYQEQKVVLDLLKVKDESGTQTLFSKHQLNFTTTADLKKAWRKK